MQSQFYPINTCSDDINALNLGITTGYLQYKYDLPHIPETDLCIFGNENLASALMRWGVDMEERLYLQTSIVKTQKQVSLQFGLEVEADSPQFQSWHEDVEVLLKIKAKEMDWKCSNTHIDLKKWKYRTFLQVENNYFNSHEKYQLRYLLEILSTLPTEQNFIIQNMVLFFWKKDKAPSRMLRNVFVVYSDKPLSSLLKHAIFRGFYGSNTPAKPIWTAQLFNKEHQSPKAVFQDNIPNKPIEMPFHQVLSMMTANLLADNIQILHIPSGDDIPF